MSSTLSIDGLSSQRVPSRSESSSAMGSRDREAPEAKGSSCFGPGWSDTADEALIPPVPPTYSPASAHNHGSTKAALQGETDPEHTTPELPGNTVLLVIAMLKQVGSTYTENTGAAKPALDIRA